MTISKVKSKYTEPLPAPAFNAHVETNGAVDVHPTGRIIRVREDAIPSGLWNEVTGEFEVTRPPVGVPESTTPT